MTIRSQGAPTLVNQPKASFNGVAFDAALWQQGYRVRVESARQCPCRTRESGSPLLTCQNCRGFGLVFINPLDTRALVTGINKRAKYVEWAEETAGTLSATLMNTDRLAENDRLTFLDITSKRSETLSVRTDGVHQFVFLTYKPVTITDVFYFSAANLPLVKLVANTDYVINTVNDYVLDVTATFPAGFNNTVTVTYEHLAQYLVFDLPHDLRLGTVYNSQGQLTKIDLPVQAIVRRLDKVITLNDYEGGIQVINNSYQ